MRGVIQSRVAGWQGDGHEKTMKDLYVVLAFFLLVGLQILRMVEEQVREGRLAKTEDPAASHISEERTRSHATAESPRSTSSCRGTPQRTT
jgi:hypothetical protein